MSYCNNSSNSKRWEFDYHFAVGYLPNHINANLFQSIKHTVQHYDQKTVSFLFCSVYIQKLLFYGLRYFLKEVIIRHKYWLMVENGYY